MTRVRAAVFSGSFYPDSYKELQNKLSSLFNECNFLKINNLVGGLIVPHAGYMYSGQVAAYGFKQISEQHFDRIVILGPSHRVSFKGGSICDANAYQTPLGDIPLDLEFIRQLKIDCPFISTIPQAHLYEHSIEVELPFIQYLFEQHIPIVPIVIGDKNRETINAIASSLHHLCSSSTLFIASSDFSHFYSDIVAQKMDYRSKELIESFDLEALFKEDQAQKIEMCGIAPILIVSMIMKKRGFTTVTPYAYSHSGEVSQDRSRVVGYWSMGYYK